MAMATALLGLREGTGVSRFTGRIARDLPCKGLGSAVGKRARRAACGTQRAEDLPAGRAHRAPVLSARCGAKSPCAVRSARPALDRSECRCGSTARRAAQALRCSLTRPSVRSMCEPPVIGSERFGAVSNEPRSSLNAGLDAAQGRSGEAASGGLRQPAQTALRHVRGEGSSFLWWISQPCRRLSAAHRRHGLTSDREKRARA
jgi:hypothetical protein